MREKGRRKLIQGRLNDALSNMYHNARPDWPRNLDEDQFEDFMEWLDMQVEWEFDYINGGGPHGYSAGRPSYCSLESINRVYPGHTTEWQYMKRKIMYESYRKDMVAYGRCWEILDYGKVYSWGRGGATVAPSDLISMGGGSRFSIRQFYSTDLTLESMVDMILIVEAFNDYVHEWCKGVPDMWADHVLETEIEEESSMIRDFSNLLESNR